MSTEGLPPISPPSSKAVDSSGATGSPTPSSTSLTDPATALAVSAISAVVDTHSAAGHPPSPTGSATPTVGGMTSTIASAAPSIISSTATTATASPPTTTIPSPSTTPTPTASSIATPPPTPTPAASPPPTTTATSPTGTGSTGSPPATVGAAAPGGTVATPGIAGATGSAPPVAPTIASIEAKVVDSANNAKTGRRFLSELYRDLKTIDPKAKVKAETAKSPGGFDKIQRYTHPQDPTETYYKVTVKYTLTCQDPSDPEATKDITFEREIFTTASKPGDALAAAQAMMDLAVNAAKDSTKSKIEGYDALDAGKKRNLLDQSSISINFNRDKDSGTILDTSSFSIGKETIKLKPSAKKFVQRVGKRGFTKVDASYAPLPGEVRYDNKIQAVQHRPYVVENPDLVKNIQTGAITFEKLKADREKKEKELKETRAQFNATFLGWTRDKRDPTFEKFVELSEVQREIEQLDEAKVVGWEALLRDIRYDSSASPAKWVQISSTAGIDATTADIDATQLARLNEIRASYTAKNPGVTTQAIVDGMITRHVNNQRSLIDTKKREADTLEREITGAKILTYNTAILSLEKQIRELENMRDDYQALLTASLGRARTSEDLDLYKKINKNISKKDIDNINKKIKAARDQLNEIQEDIGIRSGSTVHVSEGSAPPLVS